MAGGRSCVHPSPVPILPAVFDSRSPDPLHLVTQASPEDRLRAALWEANGRYNLNELAQQSDVGTDTIRKFQHGGSMHPRTMYKLW